MLINKNANVLVVLVGSTTFTKPTKTFDLLTYLMSRQPKYKILNALQIYSLQVKVILSKG